MSRFVDKVEDMATLEEALEFIDTCYWFDDGISDSSPSGVDDSPVSGSPFQIEDAVELTLDDQQSPYPATYKKRAKETKVEMVEPRDSTAKPKKKQRSVTGSSTRLQQRKKAELLFLRKHVRELEEYVTKLKTTEPRYRALVDRMYAEVVGVAHGEPSPELLLAATRYRERLEAEEMNRRLKAIVTSQLQLNESLGMNFVMTDPEKLHETFEKSVECVPSDSQLHTKIKSLNLEPATAELSI